MATKEDDNRLLRKHGESERTEPWIWGDTNQDSADTQEQIKQRIAEYIVAQLADHDDDSGTVYSPEGQRYRVAVAVELLPICVDCDGEGSVGQDRANYTDTQDRDSYDATCQSCGGAGVLRSDDG
jgi:hypothetical protein